MQASQLCVAVAVLVIDGSDELSRRGSVDHGAATARQQRPVTVRQTARKLDNRLIAIGRGW